jgi:hypothetical protein
MPDPAPDGLATLRARLIALRDDLRQRLAAAETIEPAWLATLANVETVLAGLDRDGTTVGPVNA